jgi:hypothetical protein
MGYTEPGDLPGEECPVLTSSVAAAIAAAVIVAAAVATIAAAAIAIASPAAAIPDNSTNPHQYLKSAFGVANKLKSYLTELLS